MIINYQLSIIFLLMLIQDCYLNSFALLRHTLEFRCINTLYARYTI